MGQGTIVACPPKVLKAGIQVGNAYAFDWEGDIADQ